MIQLAFYKGKGDWSDKLIRLWTRSKYSHTELVIDDLWYSSSPRDGEVRIKYITPKPGHWDFIEIDVTKEQKENMLNFFNSQIGKKYDFKGIFLSQVLPFNIQDPEKWFCSEIDSKALIISYVLKTSKPAQWYSPERLFRDALKIGKFIKG